MLYFYVIFLSSKSSRATKSLSLIS